MVLTSLLPAGLLKDTRLVRREWSTALGLSIMVNILILVQPVFMLHVYDYVLPSQSQVTLLLLTGMALFVVCASALMDYLRSRVLIDIGREIDVQLRERAFKGAFAQAVNSRRFLRAAFVNDLETVRGFISGPSAVALMDLPWMPLYILALFVLSPWLGLLSLTVGLIVLAIGIFNERHMKPMVERSTLASQNGARLADDVLQSAPASQSMGFTGALLDRWVFAARYAGRLGEAVAIEGARSSAFVRSLRLSLQIMALALAAWLVLEQKLTSGSIVAASLIGARAVGPIEACISGWRRFVAARIALNSLQAFAFSADAADARPTALPAPQGSISLQGVSFADSERRVVILNNVTFNAPAGAMIGVVGKSGSGKTSLLHLIAGAAPASAGTIRIDGAEIGQWRRDMLGPHIGFLPQTTLLHRGTVAENIRRFGPVDDEGVLKAAKLSGAHPMILELPDGYDTDIGEGGGTLSGGQKQRLGLARAVYGDPRLLLLDEPTSALDGEAEELFWRMIAELRAQKKTIFLVAHRPSHVQGADFIAVMDQGKLRQFGPTKDVLPTIVKLPPQPQAKPASTTAKKAS